MTSRGLNKILYCMPKKSGPIYIEIYYMKAVKNFWTESNLSRLTFIESVYCLTLKQMLKLIKVGFSNIQFIYCVVGLSTTINIKISYAKFLICFTAILLMKMMFATGINPAKLKLHSV